MRSTCAVTCPHITGSIEGACCRATGQKIRDMEGGSLSLCMGRHYEACQHYFLDLRRTALQSLPSAGI